MKVGFVGIGNMGSAMARNLIKAGHALVVYNKTRSRAEELRPLGATVANTPAEAAAGAEALITMVADDHAVEDVIFGHGKIIDSLPAGSVHISMSTMSVAMSHRLVAAHRERKQHYIAAPVFGRPDAAAAAKIFIVASGPAQQIERCRSLFDAMGQKTFVVGEEAPAANLVKITGNFLITTVIESLAESFCAHQKIRSRSRKISGRGYRNALFRADLSNLWRDDRRRQFRACRLPHAFGDERQPISA